MNDAFNGVAFMSDLMFGLFNAVYFFAKAMQSPPHNGNAAGHGDTRE